MEKPTEKPIDTTNIEQLREKNLSPDYEEPESSVYTEDASSESLSWSDIVKSDNTPMHGSEFSQEEFDLVQQQRNEILNTAEQIRTGERVLSSTEIKELGKRAYDLARQDYLGPAQAESMMIDLAASTQDKEHSVLAHRTINEQFNLSSPEHRRDSHEIASRVISMVNKENIDPATAHGIALEQGFVDRYGYSSDESIIKQIEAAKLKRDEDEANKVHLERHARFIDSYGDAINTIRRAESDKERSIAGNTLANFVFEIAEAKNHTPDDIIVIESAARVLEEHKKFELDAKELHELAAEIIKNAPSSQEQEYQEAFTHADDETYLEKALRNMANYEDNIKTAA